MQSNDKYALMIHLHICNTVYRACPYVPLGPEGSFSEGERWHRSALGSGSVGSMRHVREEGTWHCSSGQRPVHPGRMPSYLSDSVRPNGNNSVVPGWLLTQALCPFKKKKKAFRQAVKAYFAGPEEGFGFGVGMKLLHSGIVDRLKKHGYG